MSPHTIYKSINLHLIKTRSLKRQQILIGKDEDKEFSISPSLCQQLATLTAENSLS